MKKRTFNLLALTAFICAGALTITSCGEKKVDIVGTTDIVRLRVDYKDGTANRDFFTSGVAEVQSLADDKYPYTVIDGDTVHFKALGGKELIKTRFYGVDTPESTGTVQPFGEKAKLYVKDTLEKAKTIVLSSTAYDSYVRPETDSTGSRYLSLVWFSEKENCPYNELKSLNLSLVQEGLSYVKNVEKIPDFKDTFIECENQAKKLKLNLHSDHEDDSFNYGDYQMTDLKVLNDAIISSLESGEQNEYNNKRVRVRGTVAGYANHMLYLQTPFEDPETGEIRYCGINVFTGMSPVSSKYTRLNTQIELSALALDNENFGFQLTGVYSFPATSNSNDKNDTKIVFKSTEIPEEFKVHEFKLTARELGAANYDCMFSPVSVEEELTIVDGYDSSDGNETTLICQTASGQKADFKIFVPFKYQPDPDNVLDKWDSIDEFRGHTLKVKGIYTFHKSQKGDISWQIVPRDSNDITLIA